MPYAEPMLSGTAEPGLDLVADEEPSVAPDDLRHPPEIAWRRHDVTPDSLDRLRDQRGGPAAHGRLDDLLQIVDVASTHVPSHGLRNG